MLSRLLRRPSHGIVVAYLALFVALGGSAYAVNTISSADIVDGEVKSVDVGDSEIKSADVKDQSLTTFDVSTFLGADVVDGTLTGADVGDNSLAINDIGSESVGADEVLNNSLLSSDLSTDSAGGDEIASQSVGADEVVNNSLLSSDLSTSSVGSDEVTNDSLTGADINESTLNVPHIPTTANFWFAQFATSNDNVFVQVASKTLPAGDYVFLATINTTGCPGCFHDEHIFDAECQLRNPSGGVIGGTTDRRWVPADDEIRRSLSFNGGTTIPAAGGTVSVWCRGDIQENINNGQILTLRVDGFN